MLTLSSRCLGLHVLPTRQSANRLPHLESGGNFSRTRIPGNHAAALNKYSSGGQNRTLSGFRYPYRNPMFVRFPWTINSYLSQAPFAKRMYLPNPGKADTERIMADAPERSMRRTSWPHMLIADEPFPTRTTEANAWRNRRDHAAHLSRIYGTPWTAPSPDGDERARQGLVTLEVASSGAHRVPDTRLHAQLLKANRAVPGLQKRQDEAGLARRLVTVEEHRLMRVKWLEKAEKYLLDEGLRAEHFSGGADASQLEAAVRNLRR